MLAALRGVEEAAVASGARVVLTVDAPSIWLRLARRVRARGLAVVHWTSPQVWAWRPERVRAVARSVDTVLCLFPFEPPLYQGHVRAVFVGHPAAAVSGGPLPAAGRPRIGLAPGSRPTEIRALWPVLREVARRLRSRWPDAELLVPVARGVDERSLTGLDCAFVDGVAGLAGAEVAVVASGTATLELAALDVPMVVVYRVHPLTWQIGRRLVHTPWVALPNVLAGRRLVPEHLQDLDPEAIAADAAALVGSRGQVPRELVATLAGPEAWARTAEEVARWVLAPGRQRDTGLG
jgi:lipid-A-disaccharide synthase